MNSLKQLTPNLADIRKVRITDRFYAPWLEKIRSVTVPDVFHKFLETGALENYRRVIRGEHGTHDGHPWAHGLVCEVIRGVSDLLAVRPDATLEAQLDMAIDLIRQAQSPDGWLHPYDTLMCPGQEWGLNGGNARYQHETYDCGCLVEAGVHHFRATGKSTLLECAVKCANYLVAHIGPPPKWNITCEHPLAESALFSLEHLLEERPELVSTLGACPGEYRRLARFFIDSKGNHENRHQFPPFLQEFAQDHRPAREQREAVGHAVRATLFYAAMAECAMDCGDEELATAAKAIWRDVAETKLHINGSVGAFADNERFGAQYELPNDAYLETCAGVGLLFFAAAMFRLTGEAAVWEVAESTILNLLPAAVAEDGMHYTYVNPLESRGQYERWSWHGCPCCPPMLLKAVGELPSYLFAHTDNDLWVNLFLDAEATAGDACLSLQTAANGKRLVIQAATPKRLHLRVPAWAQDFALSRPHVLEKGYAVVEIPSGETCVELSYSADPVKVMAHPWVAEDRGRVAVKVGPVLYCCETPSPIDPVLSLAPPVWHPDGTVTVATEDGKPLALTEYRRWNNRGAQAMRVWFRQAGHASNPFDLNGWEGKLYREFPPQSCTGKS